MDERPLCSTIRRIRSRLDMSQSSLAKLLGVGQTVVSQYELGQTAPSSEQLIKILGLPMEADERASILNALRETSGLTEADVALLLKPVRQDQA